MIFSSLKSVEYHSAEPDGAQAKENVRDNESMPSSSKGCVETWIFLSSVHVCSVFVSFVSSV